ncbi:MAG: ABC transporter substrate-binding protein [Desulfovibrio sp.]|jgi:branched-chain amino acid transport system substrate-binding protein|nr:ABC transporter substrate-binding protein [Desulfovibrio sp.]
MKRIFWICLVVLGLFASGSALAAEKLKIGLTLPMSGLYAEQGKLEHMAMQMALKDLDGKIGGRPAEFIIVDTEANPDIAGRRTRALMEKEGVKFLLGDVSTSSAIAISTVVKENGGLYINTNANGDDLTSTRAVRNMFRIPPNMSVMARAVANYAFDNIPGKKWIFLTHDYSWGHSGARWARDVLKKRGATEIGELKVPIGTRDFSAQLLQIRNSGADAVIVTVGGSDRVALMKQVAEYRIPEKMVYVDTLTNYVDVWGLKPEERSGFWAAEMSHDESPQMLEFAKRFKAAFPDAPSPVVEENSYNGYVGIMALNEAMEKAGTTEDVGKIILAMEGLEVKRNLRDKPTYIDPRTHQFMNSMCVVIPDPEAKLPDIWKVVKKVEAAEYEMTEEENPIDLRKEPLPK